MPDPAVIRRIIKIGQERGMSREAILGALSTGLVESNLTNIKGGDRDSSGWRQERASLYPDPNNLTNSINRFFNEWEQHDRPGWNPGLTAANVQRPAEQYRGRYAERMDEAKKIFEQYAGAGGGSIPDEEPTSGGTERVGSIGPNPFQAISAMSANRQGPYADIMNRGWDLLGRIWEQKFGSQPRTVSAPTIQPPTGGGGGGGGRGLGGLREAFYDPVGGWDEGKSIGAIGGHGKHAHFGGGPKTIARVIAAAQDPEYGLTVRENEAVDPVDPVHTEGSWHYRFGGRGGADISGDPQKLDRFFRDILRRARWR